MKNNKKPIRETVDVVSREYGDVVFSCKDLEQAYDWIRENNLTCDGWELRDIAETRYEKALDYTVYIKEGLD